MIVISHVSVAKVPSRIPPILNLNREIAPVSVKSRVLGYNINTTVIHKFLSHLCTCQSKGFTSRSTARVILGQDLSIVTCGSPTHTEVTAYGDAKLAKQLSH